MTLTKKERENLARQIRQASGIAQYALLAKMTDEQLEEAAQHLSILKLVKSANDYNRHCQAQKTKEANDRVREFLDVQNSEILKAGRWLVGALAKSGPERRSTLLEQDLVHKEDYNATVGSLRDTLEHSQEIRAEDTAMAKATIQELEQRIDELKFQMGQVREYLINNDGLRKWEQIQRTFNLKA